MSLILDALRKSERSRQQSLTGRLGSTTTPPVRSRLPVPWATLLALLLLVNAAVLGVLFLGPRPTPAPEMMANVPVTALAADYHPNVRPLSEEVSASDQGTSRPAAVSATPAGEANVPLAAEPVVAANAAALPTYDSLTPDQRQGVPALHLDVHAYAQDPAQRFVVINLKRYRVGDALTEGPTLKDIVPLGAVLEYHGVVFLLPAN